MKEGNNEYNTKWVSKGDSVSYNYTLIGQSSIELSNLDNTKPEPGNEPDVNQCTINGTSSESNIQESKFAKSPSLTLAT